MSTEPGILPDLPDTVREHLYKQLDDGIASRLSRDSILTTIYGNICEYDRDIIQKYYTKRNAELLEMTYNETDDYIDLMHRTAHESVIADHIDSPTDLMIPERIPNEYNIESRCRVRSIMSSLYKIRKETSIKDSITPYEMAIQLTSLDTDYDCRSTIYTAKYMDYYPMLVKSTESVLDSHMLLHEYLVGTVVNSLRTDIANFMYTYGLSNDMCIYNVCDCSYFYPVKRLYNLYVELVENAVTMYNMPDDMSCRVYCNGTTETYRGKHLIRLILLQILCAISYAYSKIGFIHRDLNLRNIMLVKLPSMKAVPIMIPTAEHQFVKRWIQTDLLVVLVDYGLSTVDAVHLKSSTYTHDYLVSPQSIYMMYEGRSAFENDIAILLRVVFGKVTRIYDESDVEEMSRDFVNILYRMYTGTDPPDSASYKKVYREYLSKTAIRYYCTHPLIQYDPYGAVVDFCNRYTDLYVSDSPTWCTDILSRSIDRDYSLTTITDTRRYYWYLRYSDLFSDLHVDLKSIAANKWYSAQLPTVIQKRYTTKCSTEWLIYTLSADYTDLTPIVLLILSIYRYLVHHKTLRLYIEPFTYKQPEDLLHVLIDELNNTRKTCNDNALKHLSSISKMHVKGSNTTHT